MEFSTAKGPQEDDMVSSIDVSVITMTAHLRWCLFTTIFNIIIIYLYLPLQPVSWTVAWKMHPWLHPLPYCWKRTENRFQRGRLLQPRMKQWQRHLEVPSLEETWGSHRRASTLTVIPSPCEEIQSLCCLANVCTCVYVLNWQLLLRAFQDHSETKNSNKPNRLGISTGRRQTINFGHSQAQSSWIRNFLEQIQLVVRESHELRNTIFQVWHPNHLFTMSDASCEGIL